MEDGAPERAVDREPQCSRSRHPPPGSRGRVFAGMESHPARDVGPREGSSHAKETGIVECLVDRERGVDRDHGVSPRDGVSEAERSQFFSKARLTAVVDAGGPEPGEGMEEVSGGEGVRETFGRDAIEDARRPRVHGEPAVRTRGKDVA